MNEVIYAAVYFTVTLGAFLLGKYVFPNIPKTVTDKLGELSEWAAKFVEWAKRVQKGQDRRREDGSSCGAVEEDC